ncbi:MULTISPECIES: YggS family pyridoxal phosphate-dependent enzyme [Aneurinibacillus]|uniref:Pyridoxal phosphate homeostasis protein n=2 Tax=Aneurinibacillus thermoaerophilus TaxID=143495 RepID=A0A1G7W949_ANETH|nr:YggS family pyridoxal phosphate-dependent enzyme [Aneurinibacillus thermoaerophilus]MED0674707.1 YggS family pyridoxal phosphate-dependent enzyme [Aneurinibacillus thermoaerophilus]MED0680190.1 YggS family pyridoxal phosphate-dependent enzyme [Aneurinibacillus thermoaerophilus]MED0736861.1 YggS family pyridoxal phosphate-dependent enzyme [Aneurinibacillus thermoaerophilus]MED0756702.1 YggS family pyridoxal phosphate-dependent enzyme [Aneurinibacillus thermoaerophilus]MED0760752.1 YggS famil
MSYIAENLRRVQAMIEASCERVGRKPSEVQIVAVTKYVSLETTRAAISAGIHHIGESRTQDAVPKWQAIGTEAATWHFIGHLQTNKVKDMVGRFTYVHSLDRFSLAKELNKRGAQHDVVTKCMVQVNVSGEETKHGLAPQEVPDFLAAIQDMPHIEACGFMTMAPYVENPEETRWIFRELRQLRDRMRKQYAHMPLHHLSMGMSNDYHIAVEEGATFIRLGSTLVGDERN